MKVRKSRKKNRKHGRNKTFCDTYRRENKQQKSHARRLLNHITRYGATDHIAVGRYNEIMMFLKPGGFTKITPKKSKHKQIQPKIPMNPFKKTPKLVEIEG